MWNFLIAGLSIGCALVLYDGSPLRDVPLLWKMVDDLKITIFGTSAKYLDYLSVCFFFFFFRTILISAHRKNIDLGNTTISVLSGTSIPPALRLHPIFSIMSMNKFIHGFFWVLSLVSDQG